MAPMLPSEVLYKVFSFLGIADVRQVRQVCRAWKSAVDEFAPELWRARCVVLNLIPTRRDTVLGVCTEKTLSLAIPLHKQLSRGNISKSIRCRTVTELAGIYKVHYLKWAPHICESCKPLDLHTLCRFCTRPDTFEWIHPKDAQLKFLKLYEPRSIYCPRAPNSSETWQSGARLYRVEDVRRAAIKSKMISRGFVDSILRWKRSEGLTME